MALKPSFVGPVRMIGGLKVKWSFLSIVEDIGKMNTRCVMRTLSFLLLTQDKHRALHPWTGWEWDADLKAFNQLATLLFQIVIATIGLVTPVNKIMLDITWLELEPNSAVESEVFRFVLTGSSTRMAQTKSILIGNCTSQLTRMLTRQSHKQSLQAHKLFKV